MTTAARCSLPALVAATAAAVSLLVLPDLSSSSRPAVVAAALTVDFTVVLPGLVYLLFVRTKRAPWLVLLPTFVIGYALAAATIPAGHHAGLEAIRLLLVPAELAVVTYLVVLARRAVRRAAGAEGDFATRCRTAARGVLGSRVPADILATEISLLFHAFRGRRPAARTPGSFTIHRRVGYPAVVAGLLMVLAVETIAVHLLVRQWSGNAAWILSGLSLYACIWLVGDWRAMAARPIRVTSTHLLFRMGLRWEADIPLSSIARAEELVPYRESPTSETLAVGLVGQPNLRLGLETATEVIGMYGIRRTVREIWCTVDDGRGFCAELAARCHMRSSARVQPDTAGDG